jgi:hypothetical protein
MHCLSMSAKRAETHAIVSLLLPLLALCLALPAPAAEKVTKDGVLHIQNSSSPRHGSKDVQLEELWRAGGLDDDLIFGMITQIREDAAHNLYVMDAQLSQVHVYSPKGDRLRTLFTEGEGPGEIRGPRDLVLMNDGRVGAVQEMPGKLIFVDGQGNPAGNLLIGGAGEQRGGMCQTFSAFTNGDLLLVTGFIQSPSSEPGHLNQTNFLSSFDAEGHRIHDFAMVENVFSFSEFVFDESTSLAPFWWNAAVGPKGNVYVAPDIGKYAIEVYSPDGQLKKVIDRDYKNWPRSQADKDYFADMVKAIYSGLPFEININLLDDEPAIVYLHRGLRVHPDGSLWVLTTRGIRDPDGDAMATFDVFSSDGEFDRQVNVHAPWNGRSDGVFFLGNDRAVVVTGFADAMITQFTGGNMTVDIDNEAGSMEVIYCRVAKK